MQKYTKAELFESVPVPRALAAMGIPTIISQLINLIYNMVDAFFIGRTGNSYMMAATTVTLTLTMMNVAFSNLFGVGGGSLIARLMGVRREDDAKQVSAYSLRGCLLLSVSWSVVIGVFLEPILRVLGASANTLEFAKQYSILVIVIGSTPAILSLTLAHLLRNTGYSSQASFGLSLGGVLNIALDPLFMFVLLPRGQEVIGAALATLISNAVGCGYLLFAFVQAQKKAPLSLNLRLARGLDRGHVRSLYTVGVPSAMLTGLFDLASISVNILSAAHNDLVLAAMGIVMKVERVPNAINVGLCQGMLPIVAYNYSSGNHARMKQTIRTARLYGMVVSAVAIVLLELFAKPVTNLFLSTSGKDAADAIRTVGFAALFLRIRAAASPFQFTNYHTSFCMQAIGDGKATLLHAAVRELVFYIPIMILLDRIFGENGLAAALPVGECLGAIFALWLLHRILNRKRESGPAERA
ncbi:MAG: cation transporter [Oscillospiraceae bacterium]|nr:cation transporter [Oscillospiraceae bacterium]